MRRWLAVGIVVIFTAAIPASLQRTPRASAPESTPVAANAPAELQSALDALVDRPAWPEDEWSILAVSLESGDTLYAKDPHRGLAPASALKLFTTAAALHYLGPEFRFHTYLMSSGRIENGVLDGDLYLYGTGDPTLGTRFAPRAASVFYAFADSLAALGVREVRGAVIGDGSYFDGDGTGQGWEEDYLNAWYAAPAGALSAHENLVRLEIAPSAAGQPPTISYVPGGRGIAIANNAVTGGSGGLLVHRTSYDSPIAIDGAARGNTSHAVPVGDPARYTAALLRDVLIEKGIAVTGNAEAITDPARSPVTNRAVFAPMYEPEAPPRVLAVNASEPLREILKVINHQSHNFYAEQVLRAVGRVATGDGSAAGGVRAIEALLVEAKGDTTGLRILDGCGLSPLNRVPARAFISLLAFMSSSPHAAEFQNTMTVAGESRRFRRMAGTLAGGNLRAKTGTIDNVSALAGYVRAQNGELIAFAIIANNVPSVAQAKHVENVIGVSLASYGGAGPPVMPSEGDTLDGDAEVDEPPRDPRRAVRGRR